MAKVLSFMHQRIPSLHFTLELELQTELYFSLEQCKHARKDDWMNESANDNIWTHYYKSHVNTYGHKFIPLEDFITWLWFFMNLRVNYRHMLT